MRPSQNAVYAARRKCVRLFVSLYAKEPPRAALTPLSAINLTREATDAYPNEVATAAMFAVKRDGAAERAPLLRNGARDSTGVCV